MQATQAIRNAAMALLAADTATLAAASANKMALIMTNFTPSEQSVVTDFTLADFTGHNPISVTAGAQPEGLDPTTNDSVIDLSPPAGGFRWVTADAVNLPQTIYGYALLDNTLATVLACELLPTPVVLTAAAQVIDLGDTRLTLPANSIT